MYKYDVSIIVAVYNNDKYLRDCIESVLKQTHNIKKIQLILVNDGSTDKSLEICKEYEKNNENILVIDKENGGVSSARNAGIKKAEGKYIIILDSDDTISKNTVKSLFDFFEKYYDEVDLVTYKIVFNKDGKKEESKRYEKFDKGTNIYDIEKYIYLNQSNVNIIFKNLLEENTLYDEKMKLAEDQKFDTEIMMKKKRIGFVEEAIYYYRKHGDSVSKTENNPYYCFDDIMQYNEEMIDKYLKSGEKNRYIQSLILNTLIWRLKADELYPYSYEEEKFNKAVDRIKNLLKYIERETIIQYKQMQILHKIYFLKMKGVKFNVDIEEDGSYKIIFDNELVLKEEKLKIVLNRFKVKNDKVKILGYLRTPIYEILDKKPELYLKYKNSDGKVIEQNISKVFESNLSYYKTNIKTNTLYGFEAIVDLNEISKFSIIIKENQKVINTEIIFSKWCPFNKRVKRYKLERKKDFIVYNIKNNKNSYQFYLLKKNFINKLKYELGNIKRYKNLKALILRALGKNKKKNIWLYLDSKNIIDNAFYQFKNDIKENDGIKRYYVYDGDESFYLKNIDNQYRKFFVKFGTLKHKILFLRSKKILTSNIKFEEYCPLGKKQNYYRDLCSYDLIYLQYGVLIAELIRTYSKEFTEIEKIVISSYFEKDNFINKYNYKAEDLIETGMPRLQRESQIIKKGNVILYAPSWRNYLISVTDNGKKKLKKEIFINSEYYKTINNFLNSESLFKLLEKYNLKLDFKLHPFFKEYKNYFNVNKKYIDIIDSTDVGKYKIFITDFSSFQFDFVKIKTPIIYFIPDKEEFTAGLHSYRKIDLPYEKAFGKLTLDQEELVSKIEEIINNDFKDDKEYQDRENSFFYNLNDIQNKLYKNLINDK